MSTKVFDKLETIKLKQSVSAPTSIMIPNPQDRNNSIGSTPLIIKAKISNPDSVEKQQEQNQIPKLSKKDPKSETQTQTQTLGENQNNIEIVSEQSIDPASNLLKTKIQIRKSFMEYLQKHYGEKRIQDFIKIDDEVKKMEKALQIVQNNPGKLSIEKVDSTFPDLTQLQILGESKLSINKKMAEIIERIKQEAKEIKNKKTSEAVLAHYKQFFVKFNQIQDSSSFPMPEIIKEKMSVDCDDSNHNLKKGELMVRVNDLVQEGKIRSLRVMLQFSYNNETFKHDFGYNNDKGVFSKEKVFQIDKDKILKKFAKSTLDFSIYKKKM